jgi:hypothetical protein
MVISRRTFSAAVVAGAAAALTSTRGLDHVVYLSGEVSAGLMRETAEAIARKTPGVTRVEDTIAVTK